MIHVNPTDMGDLSIWCDACGATIHDEPTLTTWDVLSAKVAEHLATCKRVDLH